jgi:hypothetical protein
MHRQLSTGQDDQHIRRTWERLFCDREATTSASPSERCGLIIATAVRMACGTNNTRRREHRPVSAPPLRSDAHNMASTFTTHMLVLAAVACLLLASNAKEVDREMSYHT